MKPLPLGIIKASKGLTYPKSDPLSPEKKSIEKNARSLSRIYLIHGLIAGSTESSRRWRRISFSLSRKIGIACMGKTLSWACCSNTIKRYFLTVGWAAGLPTFRSSFQWEPLPNSLKIVFNFPILLSIVPAARNLGQEHEPFSLRDEAQSLECKIVLPNLSRQIKKLTISWGVVIFKFFLSGRDHRYDSNWPWRALFFGVDKASSNGRYSRIQASSGHDRNLPLQGEEA